MDDWNLKFNLPLEYLEFETHFRERFDFYQEYTQDSIREILCKFVQKYATRLNKRGGSYFVPANSQNLLDRVRGFIEAIGAAKGFEQFELYGSAQNQQQVAQSLTQNFEVEIAQLLQKTQEFIASADPSRKSYGSSISRRQEEVIIIQERLKLFEGILSFKADELRNTLGQVSQLVSGVEQASTIASVKRQITESNIVPIRQDIHPDVLAVGF